MNVRAGTHLVLRPGRSGTGSTRRSFRTREREADGRLLAPGYHFGDTPARRPGGRRKPWLRPMPPGGSVVRESGVCALGSSADQQRPAAKGQSRVRPSLAWLLLTSAVSRAVSSTMD